MNPGASPLQSTITPACEYPGLPKNTCTAPVTASGLVGDTLPVVTAPPVVAPRPVAYIVNGSSRVAGLFLFTYCPFAWNSANCPVLSTNTAGAYFATVTFSDVDAARFAIERTTSGYVPAAVPGGICALICCGLVSSSGSATLFHVTHVPPIIRGSGVEAGVARVPKFCPKMESSPFGATPAV